MWETWVWSLGWEDPLEEGMATHSSILAWRIPMDRGTWRATVPGVRKNWTQLTQLSDTPTPTPLFKLPLFSSLLHSWGPPGRNTAVGCHASSRGSSRPRDWTCLQCCPRLQFTQWQTWRECGSAGKESACSMGDPGSIPGLGRSPAEGYSSTLQYSGLENSVDRIVAKSWTWLSDFHFSNQKRSYELQVCALKCTYFVNICK